LFAEEICAEFISSKSAKINYAERNKYWSSAKIDFSLFFANK